MYLAVCNIADLVLCWCVHTICISGSIIIIIIIIITVIIIMTVIIIIIIIIMTMMVYIRSKSYVYLLFYKLWIPSVKP
jgi:hypothetical protein